MGFAAQLSKRVDRIFSPWPKHPIDAAYGIETSAKLPSYRLGYRDAEVAKSTTGYASSQPSIIRAAIRALPKIDHATFIDLGCGKGRPLAVATEFPFRRIVGVELSPALCRMARKNMAVVAQAHPARTRAEIWTGDATMPELPDEGMVVLYFANSFRADLTGRLMQYLALHLAAHPRLKLFLIYYAPAAAALLDAAPGWRRHYAARHDFAPDEMGSSPFGNDFDSVVIWQSVGEPMSKAHPGADRRVVVTIPDLGADVEA